MTNKKKEKKYEHGFFLKHFRQSENIFKFLTFSTILLFVEEKKS